MANITGTERTGEVWIRDFDRGVITTLGCVVHNWSFDGENKPNYFLEVNDLSTSRLPSDKRGVRAPAVPVTFRNPSNVFESHLIPGIEVSRDEPALALSRWHSIGIEYKTPADGSVQSSITLPDGTELSGYNQYETKIFAWPYDITYTIIARAERRSVVQPILKKILRVYQPYCSVSLIDSIGQERSYEAFQEGLSDLSEVIDVAERVIGWSMTLRVEGEIDLNDPVVDRAVTEAPAPNYRRME